MLNLKNVLFLSRDFLLEKEIREYVSDGTLTQLFVVESQKEKKYVQDSMIANGQEIAKFMMDENALLYFCGYESLILLP